LRDQAIQKATTAKIVVAQRIYAELLEKSSAIFNLAIDTLVFFVNLCLDDQGKS